MYNKKNDCAVLILFLTSNNSVFEVNVLINMKEMKIYKLKFSFLREHFFCKFMFILYLITKQNKRYI